MKSLLVSAYLLLSSSPAMAQRPSEIILTPRLFNSVSMPALRREDISCRKTTGAGIYMSCKTRGQASYDSCGHYYEGRIYYLSFGSLKNPACPAALYFGFFDDPKSLREAPTP